MSEEQMPETVEEEVIPPQYYADFDADGNIAGFYVDNIHDVIPETALPISVEDWQLYIVDSNKYKLDGGVIREKTQQELEDEAAARPPAPKSPMQKLQEENADLWYEVMRTEAVDETQDNEIADLWYELMTGGVA